MKKLYLALMLPCILFSLSTLAEEEQLSLQPQSQGDVTFVSGGVGSEEQQAIQAMRANYNLNLLFSVQETGEYLSDVKVTITDKRGNVFLETVTVGPKLLVNLKPGSYIVTAEQDGRVQHKTATVGGNHSTSLSFIWHKDD